MAWSCRWQSGNEVVGRVVKLGPDAKGVKVGDLASSSRGWAAASAKNA